MRRLTTIAHAIAPWFLACALLATLQASRSAALADDSQVGAIGGSVHPVRSKDIRMVAETVQATCFGSFAEYRVDFRFVNDGPARRVRLGFPFSSTVSGEHGSERPVGFEAWQNGRPLAVRAIQRSTREGTVGYFLHRAVFPHGATMITVSYLASPSGTAVEPRKDMDPDDPAAGTASSYQYWLHTGSTWKGPIGKAVVRYRFADSFRGSDIALTTKDAVPEIPVTSPPGWTNPLPRTYQWHFSRFEPAPDRGSDWWEPRSTYDVTLAFTQPGERRALRATWTWSSAARGFGERGYSNLQDGDLGSCWAEGVPGLGAGEWVAARFRRPTHLRELRILPGNNAYDAAFTQFARPKTITAVFSDGSSLPLHLNDAPSLQRFPVDVTTRSVRLVIDSAYRGTEFPGTCISEVEFGTRPAPTYAPFRRLIVDPRATGRLTAWAGPAVPASPAASRPADWREAADSETYACGDLIGLSDWATFPQDTAPFKEPASLAAVTSRDPAVTLPDPDLVGQPVAVAALSYWTYEIRYSSGIDLLVNTRLAETPRSSLLSTLADETGYLEFTDGRGLPFDAVSIGRQAVGVARPGILDDGCGCDCSEDGPGDGMKVPAQVFWRSGGLSYHLFARAPALSTDRLLAVARAIIVPWSPGSTTSATPATATVDSPGRLWLPLVLVTIASLGGVSCAAVRLVRRRTAAQAVEAADARRHPRAELPERATQDG